MILQGLGPLPTEASLSDVAAVLGLTSRRVSALVAQGVITKRGRGNFPLIHAVQEYMRWRVESAERNKGSQSADKLRDARAKELEIRIVRREAELVPLREALHEARLIADLFLESISGLPARITKNPRERQRVIAICEEERRRLSNRFAETISALERGIDDVDADEDAE